VHCSCVASGVLHGNISARAYRLRSVCTSQVQAWSRDLHRSQLHMRNLTASRPTTISDDSSSNAGDADAEPVTGTSSETSSAAQAKPVIEIRAGLGELALIISGRACDDWWPPQARSLQSMLSLDLSCMASDRVTPMYTSMHVLSHGSSWSTDDNIVLFHRTREPSAATSSGDQQRSTCPRSSASLQ